MRESIAKELWLDPRSWISGHVNEHVVVPHVLSETMEDDRVIEYIFKRR